MDDSVLRASLVELLRGGNAYVTAEKALADVEPELRNARAGEGLHSVWEELEHIRIAQEDILRYTLDAAWKSPKWPDGYWPARRERVTDDVWAASVAGFVADRSGRGPWHRSHGADSSRGRANVFARGAPDSRSQRVSSGSGRADSKGTRRLDGVKRKTAW